MTKQSLKQPIIVGFFSGAFGALIVLVIALRLVSTSAPSTQLGSFLQALTRQIQQPLELPLPAVTGSQESLVVQAVRKAKPAVVSIVISRDVPVIERYYEGSELDPFSEFFGLPFQLPQFRQNGTERRQIGGGSGFLVSADGLIVTNRHVVSQEDAEYTVFTNDGKKHEAKVIARDPVNDLAIMKIEGSNYPFLQFGDSEKLEAGQTVISIGNALAEFSNTVSVGVISGLSRSIVAGDGAGGAETLEGVIQTDAAINPGNSGGPLLTTDGKVIGVNVAIVQGSQNIGFALPSALAKNVVESVQKSGKIVRPFLGVRYIQINEQVKTANKLSVDYGALVVRGDSQQELAVTPGSPASQAGINENDILLEIDGVKLDGTRTLSSIIREKNVGDTVRLKILRNGEERTVEVTLAELS